MKTIAELLRTRDTKNYHVYEAVNGVLGKLYFPIGSLDKEGQDIPGKVLVVVEEK